MNIELASKFYLRSASKAEKKEFQDWLDHSIENKKAYSEFVAAWDKLGEDVRAFNPKAEEAWEKISLSSRNEARIISLRNRKIFRWVSVAAAFVVSFGISLLVYKSGTRVPVNSVMVEYSTKDSVKSIVLTDGTSILLNKNTLLYVPQWNKRGNRIVELYGEAFFDVTHNEKRPFIVKTKHSVVQVLGTSFNYRTSNSKNELSLITGKVKFSELSNQKNFQVLAAGEKLIYDCSTKTIAKSSLTDNNFLAWKTNILKFENSPANYALKSIADYYNLKFREVELPDNLYLNSQFIDEPLTKVIEVLELTWDAKIDIRNDSLLVSFK